MVHLAARVHVMTDNAHDPLGLYRQANVEGTGRLADQAVRAGVKRFIYLSSVKVLGEENENAYSEADDLCPEDDYGISKMEAEESLKAFTGQSGMDHVILRPPLVYGPEVKANFLALMRMVGRKMPLPLATVKNHRSFVYTGNLVDCIFTCMNHPAAAGQTYLVSDDRDLSTPELIRLIASALNKTVYLFPCPQTLLRSIARLLGKGNATNRLFGSLTVDISKIKKELSWTPPFTVESGLLNTAKWFIESQSFCL